MADIVLKGNTSGSITIASPDVSGVNVLTLPVETGTILTTSTPLPEVSSVEFAGAGTSSGSITIAAPETDETNTLTFPETTGIFATENSLGTRNIIINGDMIIDQRNDGAPLTITADNNYGLDRWVGRTFAGAGRFSMQRVEDAPYGFTYSNKITVTTTATSGAGGYGLEQRIEGSSLTMLNWGTADANPLTASFWMKSSVVGIYSCALRTSTSSVSGMSHCVIPFTIAAADTWQKVIITFPPNTAYDTVINNITGIFFDISFGAQTSKSTSIINTWALGNFCFQTGQTDVMQTSGATINITGVQLEVNTTATRFEYLQRGTQLALCQRYYYKWNTSTSNNWVCWAMAANTTNMYGYVSFPTTMRSNPSSIQRSGLGWWLGGAVTPFSAVGISESGTDSCTMNFTSTGLTAQKMYGVLPNGATNYIAFNSEL